MPIDGLGLEAFFRGLLHPFLTPSHALALLGLGLLIGQQSADRRFLLPLILFALALAGGLVALTFAIEETPAGNLLLAAIVLSGALAALAIPVPIWALGPLAALMGAMLGLDSPPDLLSLRDAYLMLTGTGLGACIGLAAASGCAARAARHWQRIGVRVLGSWTAASAMLALALRLTR
jgi:hydrogenase/urease accessory protein HupE